MVAIVVAAVLVCYWPALHGGFLWDDPAHVTAEELRSWTGLWRIWFELGATQQYYPVLHSAFWIEHRLWGDAVVGYHLTNILLHAASCCLLAAVLRRLWSMPEAAPDGGASHPGQTGFAWLAALLFAVHPVCVESVAWISEQKNTLSLVFYLMAGFVYLDFFRHRRRRSYILATVLFLLALGTKTVTATLPAAILVVVWWRHGRLSWRRDVVPLLPWFVAAMGAGLFTSWVERTYIGAQGARFDLSAAERVLLASRDVWFYLGKLTWPAELTFFYPRWDVASAAPSWFGYLLAGAAVTTLSFFVRRRTRGPLAAWLLFVGSLFPALGFFNVYPFLFSYVADHFQYLACMVFSACVVGGLVAITVRPIPRVRLGAGIFGGVLVVGLGFASRGQSGLYRDMETLFSHTIAAVPDSWMAHFNLGIAHSRTAGRDAEAIAEYRRTIALNPTFPEAHYALALEFKAHPQAGSAVEELERAIRLRPLYAEALDALGSELAKDPARRKEAIEDFKKALLVRPRVAETHVHLANVLARDPATLPEAMAHFEEALYLRPDFTKAHNDYALVLANLPDHRAEAIRHFEQALSVDPDYAEAHYNLANTLAEMPGRAAEAIAQFEQALRVEPESPQVHYGLANVLAFQPGRAADAVSHYEAALRFQPEFAEAHANLANVLVRIPGRMSDAIEHYEAALRIDPKLAWVHFNLALHLAQIPGRAADALVHYDEALRLKPEYPDALNGAAILLAQEGHFEEARARWTKALAIDPNYQTARQNLRLLDRMIAQPK